MVRKRYLHACLASLLVQLVLAEQVMYDDWKLHVDYFENVTLTCSNDTSAVNLGTGDVVTSWILPNSETIRPGGQWENIRVSSEGFNLSISRLEDEDFGVYYCIVKSNDSSHVVSVVRKGVNVDGAYYGQDVTDELKHDAIVGGIAAGAMFILCVATWIICANCDCRDKPKLIDDVEGDQKEVELENHGDASKRKHIVSDGDNIYYIADGIPAKDDSNPAPVSGRSNNVHSEHLMSTESGHYHSIGSLERDRTLSDFEAKLDQAIEKEGGASDAHPIEVLTTALGASLHAPHASVGSLDENNSVFEDESVASIKLDDSVEAKNVLSQDAEDNVAPSTTPASSSGEFPPAVVPDDLTETDSTPMYSTPNKVRKEKEKVVVEVIEGADAEWQTNVDQPGSSTQGGVSGDVDVNVQIEEAADKALHAGDTTQEGETDANQAERNSDVDDTTLTNYQNVLSTLVSNHAKKNDQPVDICGYG